MLKSEEGQLFRMMDRDDVPRTSADVHDYTEEDFLIMMNDESKRREYEQAKLNWKTKSTTLRKIYAESDTWSSFVPTTFLDGVLEHTTYQSVAQNIAARIDIPQGLIFQYREFEHFQRAQHAAEGTEFERKRGSRRTQQVDIHTLGVRSYVTEDETLDLPFSVLDLETRIMGSSIALEQDLLWIDSLHDATSGDNATTFHNNLQASDVDIEMLLGIITWFFSPFDKNLTSINLTNPFDGGTNAEETEHLMRLGKFRVTDIVLPVNRYFDVINNSVLQNQQIWHASRILDSGALEVPLLGARFWKCNCGFFTNSDDPDSWVSDDAIYFIDRNNLGGGTIGVRQPLTVRDWPNPAFRTSDFMLFTRLGFAVQNRRALVRVDFGS